MDRRLFIGLLAGSLLVSTPLVRAQQAGKTYRIGWLRQGVQPLPKPFWDALRELGWIEGQNIKIVPRYATAAEQFPELAAELVRLKVDLILANTTPASRAVRDATTANWADPDGVLGRIIGSDAYSSPEAGTSSSRAQPTLDFAVP